METLKKNQNNFTTNISLHMAFMKFYFVHIVKFALSLKTSHYAYISPYMHKTLLTLGDEKG